MLLQKGYIRIMIVMMNAFWARLASSGSNAGMVDRTQEAADKRMKVWSVMELEAPSKDQRRWRAGTPMCTRQLSHVVSFPFLGFL